MTYNDILEKTYAKLLSFVSYKPRSTREVSEKVKALLRSDKQTLTVLEKDTIGEAILTRLTDLRVVDDTSNLELYVQSYLLSSKPKSTTHLRTYLYKKGYPKELIDTALLKIGTTFEGESAVQSAQKKLKSFGKYPEKEKRQRLIRYLVQKGYSFDTAIAALDTMR